MAVGVLYSINMRYTTVIGIGFLLIHLGKANENTSCTYDNKSIEENNTMSPVTNWCFVDIKCEKKLGNEHLGKENVLNDALIYAKQTVSEISERISCQNLRIHDMFVAVNAAGVNLTDINIPLNWAVVHEFNISHNNITIVKHHSFGKADIRLLDMSHNKIDTIEEFAFENDGGKAMHIDTLLLQNNKLSSLRYVRFSDENKIRFIDVSYNNIDDLRWLENSAFYDVETIKADYNKITELDDSFRNKRGLIKVSLVGNSIKYMRTFTFSHIGTLEVLDLSVNDIESLQPEMFAGLQSLRYLNMSHNKIDAITAEYFVDSPWLSVLDLSHNNLDLFSLSDNRKIFPIDYLLLTENNLTADDIYAILRFPLQVRRIHTGGNRFPCRQLIYKMTKQMVHQNVRKHPEEVNEDVEIDCSSGIREERFGVSPQRLSQRDERVYVPDYRQEEDFEYLKGVMVNISSVVVEVRLFREDEPKVEQLVKESLKSSVEEQKVAGTSSGSTVAVVCSLVGFVILAVSAAFAVWKYHPQSIHYIRMRFR